MFTRLESFQFRHLNIVKENQHTVPLQIIASLKKWLPLFEIKSKIIHIVFLCGNLKAQTKNFLKVENQKG